jgi:acyl-CoA reductase-like NAD-dependent aldehyde dehydrogenase
MVLMELIEDLIPAGVINIINGFGAELGRALVTNPKVSKAAFTGSTATGRLVMQYATEILSQLPLNWVENLLILFFLLSWKQMMHF